VTAAARAAAARKPIDIDRTAWHLILRFGDRAA